MLIELLSERARADVWRPGEEARTLTTESGQRSRGLRWSKADKAYWRFEHAGQVQDVGADHGAVRVEVRQPGLQAPGGSGGHRDLEAGRADPLRSMRQRQVAVDLVA